MCVKSCVDHFIIKIILNYAMLLHYKNKKKIMSRGIYFGLIFKKGHRENGKVILSFAFTITALYKSDLPQQYN